MSYPYEARRRHCRFNPETVGATDTNVVKLPSGDEKALKEAVATVGPVAVGIDADHKAFNSYSSGKVVQVKTTIRGVFKISLGQKRGQLHYWKI